jgi:hypothetical protein
MKKTALILVAGILGLASCKKDLEKKFESGQTNTLTTEVSKMSEIKVPANFKWELTKTVAVKVNLEDNSFGALKHKIEVYLEDPSYKGISFSANPKFSSKLFSFYIILPNF